MLNNTAAITLIPTMATAAGTQWAERQLLELNRLQEHLCASTLCEPAVGHGGLVGVEPSGAATGVFFEKSDGETQGIRLRLETHRLRGNVISQAKATASEVGLSHRRRFSAVERIFFDSVTSLTSQLIDELRNLKTEPNKVPMRNYGWALVAGANVAFMGGTLVPQFFGLGALLAVNASGYRLPIERAAFANPSVLDQVGIGAVAGLRAYLGRHRLGEASSDLIPHRVTQIPMDHDAALQVAPR